MSEDIFFNVHLFLRERSRAGEGHRVRGAKESEVGSVCADSSEPDAGLELMNLEVMTLAEVRCSTD